MMAENVGKLLLDTQEELKFLKNELDMLQNPLNISAPHQIKQMITKIKGQLSKFEEKIGDKVDHLVTSEMMNYEETMNKLPLIPKPEIHVKDPTLRNDYRSMNSTIGFEREKRFEPKADPRYTFMQKIVNNPTSNITKKMLQDKFTLPSAAGPQNKKRPSSSLKPIKKGPITGKTTKPTGILPREIRENPFAVAPINEQDVKKGVMNLIHRGMIPKEVDLTPAFERGGSTLSLQRAQLHNHKEQFLKTEFGSVPGSVSSVKFDLKAYDQVNTIEQNSLKPQTTKASMEPYRNMSDIPNQNFKKASAKDYEEVMDTYSLHQFIIRKGKTLVDTPEFQSYKRTHFGIWDPIVELIKMLENILTDYDIKVAHVDGKKLAKLSEICFGKPELEELLGCLVNQVDVKKVMKDPKNMFKGPNGQARAIVKIQSFWRMYKARKAYKRVRVIVGKVYIIQKSIRLFLQHKQTIQTINKRKEQRYQMYRELARQFVRDWPQIKLQRRVEIHIQSIDGDESQRLSMDKFLQRQNTQITRLFALKDPLVDIIYVAPFPLPPEVLSYYSKVFELGGLNGYQNRYTILWPENHNVFPNHFPTTKLLMYSPKVLKKIKELIQGKIAYIVPSNPSTEDVDLSVKLNVPLFSGDPQKNTFYSTKSGAKSILSLAEMPIPPGSYNIDNEKDFILALAKLIAHNFHINTWIFKINDEFSGRGHAYFGIDQLRPLVELRNRKLAVNEELVLKVHEILAPLLPHKIRFTIPHLYKNYNEYMARFIEKGGVIEATPNCLPSQVSSSSVGFMVDPAGEVSILGSYDKFFAYEHVACGYFFPQKSIPNLNLQAICEAIGKAMYAQGVFGYASIDIISFPEPSTKKQDQKEKEKEKEKNKNRIFWAVDLNCYMTSYVASTLFFDFLMKGQLEKVSGTYTVSKVQTEESETAENKAQKDEESTVGDQEKRCFMYCPFVHHPGLTSIQYKTFFHLCRMKGISYDLESKAGTTFILLDSLQTGTMGLITMGRYRRNVVRYMNDALNFILSQAGQIDYKSSEASGEMRPDSMYLSDIASRVKLINRVFEKKHRQIN